MPKNAYIPDRVKDETTLARYLNYHNWSQSELALRSGLSKATIHRIINGSTKMTIRNAVKFSRIFGTNISFFMALPLQKKG